MQIIKFVIVFFYVVFSLDIEVKHADKSDILESVHLNWYAPFFSGGGYCSEAMSFMFAAHAIDFKNFTVIQHGDSVNRQFISSLSTREALMMAVYKDQNVKSSRKAKLLVNVCHSEPGAWYVPFPKYYTSQCPPVATQHSHFNIGRTMFETDRLPHGWIDRLRYLDEIWVPTEFAREIFIAGGLSAKKIRVVAEPVDCDFFKPFESIIVESNTLIARSLLEDGNDKHLRLLLELYERRASIFLFVGKFEGRKGIDLLLRAYFDAFSSDRFSGTDVMLAIVTSSYHSSEDFETQITSTLSELQAAHPSRQIPPHVILSALHQDLMPVLYNLASALVIPSHGEGWGRPHMEAMACGTPVVATNWSGPAAFVTEQNGYPLRIEKQLVDAPGWVGHKWAQPSEEHLKELLRRIASPEYRDEVSQKGLQARKDMQTRYSLSVMGEVVRDELLRIQNELRATQTVSVIDEL